MASKKETKNKKTVKARSKSRKQAYIYAVGRRKTASARIRLFTGKVPPVKGMKRGQILVNSKPAEDYFPGEVNKVAYLKPFQVTDTIGKYYLTVRVVGSGKNGQLGAMVHGFARALDKENRELYHKVLKAHKLLTRDPRARERRKPGLGGRARGKKQSPKR